MKERFTTTLDGELLQRVKIQAVLEKRSVAEILEELLSGYLSGVPGNIPQTVPPPDRQ